MQNLLSFRRWTTAVSHRLRTSCRTKLINTRAPFRLIKLILSISLLANDLKLFCCLREVLGQKVVDDCVCAISLQLQYHYVRTIRGLSRRYRSVAMATLKQPRKSVKMPIRLYFVSSPSSVLCSKLLSRPFWAVRARPICICQDG